MREGRRAAVAALVLTMVLLPWTPAGAGQRPDAPRWPCGPVVVTVHARRWQAVAEESVRQLAAASGRDFVLGDDGQVTISVGHVHGGEANASTVIGATATTVKGAQVTVDAAVSDAWVHSVFLHELGHVAGLGHVRNPHSVMDSGRLTPWRDYQPVDVEALRAVPCEG